MQTKLFVGASNDPLEAEADRAAEQVMAISPAAATGGRSAAVPMIRRRHSPGNATNRAAPGSVASTLKKSGEPLSTATRTFFESRFGHDFSRVRIHHDKEAADSARAVASQAYTVNQHVVFARGRYAPESHTGRTLLAHELAHVVQQDGSVRRHAESPEPEIVSSPVTEDDDQERLDPPLKEETGSPADGGISGLLQRQIDPDFPPGGWAEKDEAARIWAEMEQERECIANTPADPVECDPATALSWADFTGQAPGQSPYGAATRSLLRERSINTALLSCMPQSAAAQGAPSRGVQAFFDPTRSWVKANMGNPTDPALNGCQNRITQCQDSFDGMSTGETRWYAMSNTASTNCPASAVARGDRATSRDECETVFATDCADRAAAESARLLEHEQGHFDLSCAMARKTNAMLATGQNFPALLSAAQSTLSRQQTLYDNQTRHGCVAGSQTQWEADIAAGLPNVNIVIPSPRRRRRRGRR